MSNNLNIDHLDENADHPEDVVNAAIDGLANRITNPVSVPFSGTTVTLSLATQASGFYFKCASGSPGPGGACTLNMVAATPVGLFIVRNDLGQTVTVQYSGQGETPPTLVNGKKGLFCGDGLNIEKMLDL